MFELLKKNIFHHSGWLFINLFDSFRVRKAGNCLIANKFRLDVSASAVLLQRINVLKTTLKN
jgi:hypothetical protein